MAGLYGDAPSPQWAPVPLPGQPGAPGMGMPAPAPAPSTAQQIGAAVRGYTIDPLVAVGSAIQNAAYASRHAVNDFATGLFTDPNALPAPTPQPAMQPTPAQPVGMGMPAPTAADHAQAASIDSLQRWGKPGVPIPAGWAGNAQEIPAARPADPLEAIWRQYPGLNRGEAMAMLQNQLNPSVDQIRARAMNTYQAILLQALANAAASNPTHMPTEDQYSKGLSQFVPLIAPGYNQQGAAIADQIRNSGAGSGLP